VKKIGRGVVFDQDKSAVIFQNMMNMSSTSGKAGGLYCEPLKAVIKP
jgi:hypothetical protein